MRSDIDQDDLHTNDKGGTSYLVRNHDARLRGILILWVNLLSIATR